MSGQRLPGPEAAWARRSWLVLTAATWHNRSAGQPVLQSLVAYDSRPDPLELMI